MFVCVSSCLFEMIVGKYYLCVYTLLIVNDKGISHSDIVFLDKCGCSFQMLMLMKSCYLLLCVLILVSNDLCTIPFSFV